MSCYKNPLVQEALKKINMTPPPLDVYKDMKDFLKMRLEWSGKSKIKKKKLINVIENDWCKCRPFQRWNTDTLLMEAAKGAESFGAEIVKFDLFKLEKYIAVFLSLAAREKSLSMWNINLWNLNPKRKSMERSLYDKYEKEEKNKIYYEIKFNLNNNDIENKNINQINSSKEQNINEMNKALIEEDIINYFKEKINKRKKI